MNAASAPYITLLSIGHERLAANRHGTLSDAIIEAQAALAFMAKDDGDTCEIVGREERAIVRRYVWRAGTIVEE